MKTKNQALNVLWVAGSDNLNTVHHTHYPSVPPSNGTHKMEEDIQEGMMVVLGLHLTERFQIKNIYDASSGQLCWSLFTRASLLVSQVAS